MGVRGLLWDGVEVTMGALGLLQRDARGTTGLCGGSV